MSQFRTPLATTTLYMVKNPIYHNVMYIERLYRTSDFDSLQHCSAILSYHVTTATKQQGVVHPNNSVAISHRSTKKTCYLQITF